MWIPLLRASHSLQILLLLFYIYWWVSMVNDDMFKPYFRHRGGDKYSEVVYKMWWAFVCYLNKKRLTRPQDGMAGLRMFKSNLHGLGHNRSISSHRYWRFNDVQLNISTHIESLKRHDTETFRCVLLRVCKGQLIASKLMLKLLSHPPEQLASAKAQLLGWVVQRAVVVGMPAHLCIDYITIVNKFHA